jgi:hypothetical protein
MIVWFDKAGEAVTKSKSDVREKPPGYGKKRKRKQQKKTSGKPERGI